VLAVAGGGLSLPSPSVLSTFLLGFRMTQKFAYIYLVLIIVFLYVNFLIIGHVRFV